ncbi:uncharacterized protein LOC135644982 isoform X1 [Musa acuminata AAA Group]|uniref:uncharacterized protein LOC135644982 isoform X1 n=1 Tax=Musa acuminata AAA Group TaxID=214697 RepID=UPI0031CF3FBB
MTAAAATKKKRGRPRKKREGGHLHYSPPSPPRPSTAPRRTLRPRRRRTLLDDFADFDDYLDEEEEEEEEEVMEEQEGKGKRRKLNLILKLPPAGPTTATTEEERPRRGAPVVPASSFSSLASFSSYVDDDDEEDEEAEGETMKPPKKRRLDGCDDGVRSGGSGDRETGKIILLQSLKGSATGVSTSSQVAGTCLPERKFLEAVLDKIQKKDTYGVFAEPVDPEELPDYYDVIGHPMDFGTVRKKLATEAYRSFEQFEDDVFLICSNAMQYNAPDTIYFRQARSMQDIGRKEFQKLRIEGKCMETYSKCEEKTVFNPIEKKLLQMCPPRVAQENFVSDISSATTIASGGEPCTGLSTAEASGVDPATTSNGLADGSSSLGESKSEKVDDLRVKGSPSKLGKKSLEGDENRRASYNVCDEQSPQVSGMVCDVLDGEQRKLVPVGLDAEYSYARSLARFAGNLGPIAWRIASQRIESALPSGVKFGSGWVGEYEPLPTPILSFENIPQLQHQQLDTNTTLQSKMPLKDKATALGKKANGNSREVNYGIQSKLGTTIYNRGSGPVTGGNNLCGFTEVKQQSPSFISETQLRPNAAVLQQKNKQVTSKLAKVSGTFLEQAREHQQSSSSCSLVDQSVQRPEIFTGVAAFKPPGRISLDRKLGQPEPLKQTVAMVPCSTTDGRVPVGQSSNGKVLGGSSSNILGNTMGFSSKYQKGNVGDEHQTLHEYGLNHPSRLMGWPIEMLNQSNISNNSVDSSKFLPSAVPPTGRESPNTADAAAAGAWMSIGASTQSKTSVNAVNGRDSPNASASTYFYGSTSRAPKVSSRVSDDSNTTSMSQAFRQPIQVVGSEPQFCNKGLVIFPQLGATGMSRFQGQTPQQGLLRQTENRHPKSVCPPDLNISFQPPGSPVPHSSGILKDSQQPDLALQL